MCIKANLSYYSNFNYNKGNNKKQKKNPSVNLTTDNSNSRNLKSSPCNYFITEESKIVVKDKKKREHRGMMIKKKMIKVFQKIKLIKVSIKILIQRMKALL